MTPTDPDVPSKESKTPDAEETKRAAPRSDATPLAEKIGFAKLDLTVDEVEERISPRETNVFDK